MKKLLAVLLCAVMVLTPVLSLAESWADFVDRANTLMAAGNDETITLAEAVGATGGSVELLEWLNGGTLTIIGLGGATPDFINMLIGNASVKLQNVTVDTGMSAPVAIIVETMTGGEATLYVDADSKITGNEAGIYASDLDTFTLINEGEIVGNMYDGVSIFGVDRVVLSNSGQITGDYDGVYIWNADTASLLNSGQITGAEAGVYLSEANVAMLINDGQIVGYWCGVVMDNNGEAVLTNGGLLQGDTGVALYLGDSLRVNNIGSIVGTGDVGVYVDPSASADIVLGGAGSITAAPGYASIRLEIWDGSAFMQSIPALAALTTQAEIQQALASGAVTDYMVQNGMLGDLPQGTQVSIGVVHVTEWAPIGDEEGWYPVELWVADVDYIVGEGIVEREQPVPPAKPLHNRGKVNGIAYSKEWLTTTYFGISLESFFLDGSDTRMNHRSEFKEGKGNAITGTLRTNKYDEGMQYLVSPEALANLRRANVRQLVLRNGSENRDPSTTIDIIAVLAALEALSQEIRSDIRYLLFSDKGMDGEALYVDWSGNVKTMEGEIVRTYSQSTMDSFPNFKRAE